jgi:uncharacterized membrane protein YoaT (DUF817 family)
MALLFVIAAVVIFVGWHHPTLAGIITFLIGIVMLTIRPRVGLWIAAFLVGTAAEIFAVHQGMWGYGAPTYLGVPLWIPVMWANFVITLRG